MSVELPERIDFKDLLAQYDGRRPISEPSRLLELGIEDMNGLGVKMEKLAREGAETYKLNKRPPADENTLVRFTKKGTESMFVINSGVVDESVPLYFFVTKTIDAQGKTGGGFHLIKGPLEGKSSMEQYANWRRDMELPERMERQIGNLEFDEQGNFRIYDRVIHPGMRGKGMGKKLLAAAEGFFEEVVTDRGVSQDAYAEVGQLDALAWFYNADYRPIAAFQENFRRVTEADDDLCLGERLYVFPKTVDKNERDVRNHKEGIRIGLMKPIKPKTHADIEAVQDEVGERLAGN